MRAYITASRACRLFLVGAIGLVSATGSAASDLKFTFQNPTFGGNALNSSHFRGLADAQKPDEPVVETDTTQTNAQRFIANLESRLLSSLSSQVSDAIFGDNPQDSGRVVFGDTSVAFERGLESIHLTITDPQTGVTQIEVPILQVQ